MGLSTAVKALLVPPRWDLVTILVNVSDGGLKRHAGALSWEVQIGAGTSSKIELHSATPTTQRANDNQAQATDLPASSPSRTTCGQRWLHLEVKNSSGIACWRSKSESPKELPEISNIAPSNMLRPRGCNGRPPWR
jgi:hypothetical protein